MILYCDTSALVKLYTDEEQADAMRGLVIQADMMATHVIAYIETRAAFARKLRMGEFDNTEFGRAKTAFENDWSGLLIAGVQEDMIHRAGDFTEQFGLRGYDSVHLAAAEAIYSRVTGRVEFGLAVFDERLRKAASFIKMQILP